MTTYVKRCINNVECNANLKFILLISGFVLLIVLRDVFKINVPTIVITLYSGMCFFMFDINEIMAFCMFLIPFGGGIAINYILGIGIIAFLLKRNKLNISGSFFLLCALLIWEICHFFIQPFSFADFFRYAICVIMLALLYMDTKGQNDYVSAGKSFIYSTVAACMIIFLNALSYNNYSVTSYLDNILKTGQSLGNFNAYETTGIILSNNQNTIGMYCIIAIAVAFLLFQNRKLNKQETVFCISALTIFGLITGSRTFIIMYLFVILYYILINTKKGHLKRFIFITVGLLIIILIVQFMFPEIFQFINNRFGEKEILGSRDKIFSLYNDYMFKDAGRFLFGVGIQNIGDKTGIYMSPHNSIQEAFIAWGIGGIILIIMHVIIIVINAKSKFINNKIPIINYLPLLVLVIASQAGQLYSMNERILLFSLVYFMMLINYDEQLVKKIYN